jgi:hypothetical protein
MLLDLFQSLLNRHYAASVFESADSIRNAPVAFKRMAGAYILGQAIVDTWGD